MLTLDCTKRGGMNHPRHSAIGGILLAAALALLPVSSAQAIWIYFTPREAIDLAFPHGEDVEKVNWRKMSPDTKSEIQSALGGKRLIFNLVQCFQGSLGGQVVGYACIDNVIGRYRPITFMVKINHPAGDIAHYEVMTYREAIGKEVGWGPFREQFYGKQIADPLVFGEDLRNISGATLSAHHLRDAFRRLLIVYERYLRNLPALPEE